MKSAVLTLLVCVVFGLVCVTTAYAITEAQSHVIPALEALKLKPVKSEVIGGPQKFKVTKETLDFLNKAMKDGKSIVVEGDGSIKVE